jgi:signal transduction histidine kinase
VPVDRPLAARAVRNLLANAQRHAASRVEVSVVADDDRVWVHVDDDGAGVPEEQRTAMFTRFARLDEARSTDRGGSGLGLAIVASVAIAHRGGVEAGDSPLGGARVSMWFPVAQPAD